MIICVEVQLRVLLSRKPPTCRFEARESCGTVNGEARQTGALAGIERERAGPGEGSRRALEKGSQREGKVGRCRTCNTSSFQGELAGGGEQQAPGDGEQAERALQGAVQGAGQLVAARLPSSAQSSTADRPKGRPVFLDSSKHSP